MDGEELATADEGGGIFTNPLPALITGLGLTLLGLAISPMTQGTMVELPMAAGALALGIAVAIRPKAWWVLATAAGGFLMGGVAAAKSMDIAAFYLLWIAAAVAFFGFILVVVPRVMARALVSLVILYHFVGIVTAVVSAPPQPWLAEKIWLNLYRPYLSFTYLNNAYHFYAPEPGPASVLFFRLEYEPNADGSTPYRWVKVPELVNGMPSEEDENGHRHTYPPVEFTRRLSLAMSAGQTIQLNQPTFNALLGARMQAGNRDGIPMYPTVTLPPERQYREPTAVAKRWIASYAAHVASKYKHAQYPDRKVTGVKVYLADHIYFSPQELGITHDAAGKPYEPRKINDPTYYIPAFMGEFDADGNMKPGPASFKIQVAANGTNNKYDTDYRNRNPYLYWVIPIRYHGVDPTVNDRILYRDYNIDNLMRKHAGDPESEWQNQPWENQP